MASLQRVLSLPEVSAKEPGYAESGRVRHCSDTVSVRRARHRSGIPQVNFSNIIEEQNPVSGKSKKESAFRNRISQFKSNISGVIKKKNKSTGVGYPNEIKLNNESRVQSKNTNVHSNQGYETKQENVTKVEHEIPLQGIVDKSLQLAFEKIIQQQKISSQQIKELQVNNLEKENKIKELEKEITKSKEVHTNSLEEIKTLLKNQIREVQKMKTQQNGFNETVSKSLHGVSQQLNSMRSVQEKLLARMPETNKQHAESEDAPHTKSPCRSHPDRRPSRKHRQPALHHSQVDSSTTDTDTNGSNGVRLTGKCHQSNKAKPKSLQPVKISKPIKKSCASNRPRTPETESELEGAVGLISECVDGETTGLQNCSAAGIENYVEKAAAENESPLENLIKPVANESGRDECQSDSSNHSYGVAMRQTDGEGIRTTIELERQGVIHAVHSDTFKTRHIQAITQADASGSGG